eukprot:TRINITY_DN7440_c0_g1_i2.p1 TRINITY_DN7440_c0_g1~~TRINITY_DN7440_c0_g1_i2.p1  ORF type:complete len:305 (+),score=71.32 TRINITY_DN7440_c0_g1_i2:47-961(+)
MCIRDRFQERIRALEQKEIEQERLQRQESRRTARKNRDAFRKALRDMCEKGVINRKSHWKRIRELDELLPICRAMFGQEGSTAGELFGDLLEDLNEKYDKDKKRVREALDQARFTVSLETTKQEFVELVRSKALFVKEESLADIFTELKEKAERKERRRQKKLRKNFTLLLRSIAKKSADGTLPPWETLKTTITEEPSYQAFAGSADDVCPSIYEEYAQDLARKRASKEKHESSEEEGRIRSESDSGSGRDHPKSAKKRKHRHGSRDRSAKRKRSGHHDNVDVLPDKKKPKIAEERELGEIPEL